MPRKPQDPPTEESDELELYRQKRRPLATNEPFGAVGAERKRSESGTLQGRFVVHLHRARRPHYDLRLQVGRTLKSFAVPRGPSLNPVERRLAVHTEDHPLEYVDFEDIIPAGNYGAGSMIAWDVGRVAYLEQPAERGIEAGKIDFWLFGHKLNGRFALVHTKRGEGNEWLLLKKKDAYSRDSGDVLLDAPRSVLSGLEVEELEQRQHIAQSIAEQARALGATARSLPSGFEPMLSVEDAEALEDPERIYELKLDGVRIIADKRAGSVALTYRNGRNCNHSYPEIVRAMEALPGDDVLLDGEIVSLDDKGHPRFQRLGSRIQARSPLDVAHAVAQTPVAYWVFDLLAIGGLELTELPLFERKQLLAKLIRGNGFLRAIDYFPARGKQLFEFCKREGLEGVVGKKRDSRYRSGVRSADWIKAKCDREDAFVVVGYLPGKGTRARLGALALATYHAGTYRYRGRVGSGLDDASIEQLLPKLSALASETPCVELPLPEETGKLRWLKPELVVNVRYQGFTDDGRLRASVFLGLRTDVAPESCDTLPPGEMMTAPAAPPVEATPTQVPQPRAGLKLSNRDKVFWPELGYTKGDLLDYYAAISKVMLPFLVDRPVLLVRHPDGIHGKSFYQWNVPQGTPDWIRTLQIVDPDEPGKEKNVFLVEDVDTLLYIANLGCIPIHVLAARAESLDECDFLTFDLDLGEQAFARAIEVALSVRELLSEIGLVGFPKTSGQGGLHVLVPVGPRLPFASAKLMIELLGRLVTARHATFATMERRVDKRGGKLYVDTGQTGASRSIVGPYSVRAHPAATVSTPLFWEELSSALDPARFTLMSVPGRVEEVGDPYRGIFEQRPDIPSALAKLAALVR